MKGFKRCCQKNIIIIIKHETYGLSWKKHTYNVGSKKVIMTIKIVRQSSTCANRVAEK